MKRWIMVVLVILAVGVIAGAGYWGLRTSPAETVQTPVAPPTVPVSRGSVQLSVTAPGQSANSATVDLESKVSARIEDLLVKPGDSVKAGEVLAHLGERNTFESAVSEAELHVLAAQQALDSIDTTLKLSQARLDLIQAQKTYDTAKLHRSYMDHQRGNEAQVNQAKADYLMAEEAVNLAQKAVKHYSTASDSEPGKILALSNLAGAQLRRDQSLANYNYLIGKATPAEIAQGDAEVALDKNKLDTAQKYVDDLVKGTDTDTQTAKETLHGAQLAFQAARDALNSLDVTAPIDGIITEVLTKPGQSVGAGTHLFTLIDPKALEVDATVVEQDFPLVSVGQPVELYFDALPESVVTGKVSRIIPERLSGTQANYPIVVTLDQPVDHLVSGMSVDGSIVIAQKDRTLRLPRAVVRARPDGTAQVEVWANGKVEKRQVKVGLKGDSYTEILSGLSEGDLVVSQ